MVFSSIIFIFMFLPLTLILYNLLPQNLKNSLLCFASFLFYAWGGLAFAILILISATINYYIGIKIDLTKGTLKKTYLIIGIVYNLILLGFFKYFNFIADNIVMVFESFGLDFSLTHPLIPLPIGISFFTFQILSYIIDVYRGKVRVQKNFINLALYIMLFPQLIAGPIVRYLDIEAQINKRSISLPLFKKGLERFVIGLSKKVIIANTMGQLSDYAFNNAETLSTPIAWIGIVAYSLQIYYDFSAYSDMAIGLGQMFGFNFLENFNYPYISKSVKEFWRRWHISLSSWFRDYLYIPLGGSRNGTYATYKNLIIVFFLTGLWHGASWNFVIWGLWHGIFLIAERVGLFHVIEKLPKWLAHLYTLNIVMFGWVFFRADNLTAALGYIRQMIIPNLYIDPDFYIFINSRIIITLIIAIIFSAPLYSKIGQFILKNKKIQRNNKLLSLVYFAKDITILIFFIISICFLTGAEFNPFIYFRF